MGPVRRILAHSTKSSPVDTPHKRASRLDAEAVTLGGVRSVQRRIVAGGGLVALLVVAALAWAAIAWARGVLAGSPPERIADAQETILLAAAVLLGLVELSLFFMSRYIARRVTGPAVALAAAAERVADGDLAVDLVPIAVDDELGRLSRATGAMIAELRRLVRILRESARETAAMSAEITAGTEQMSASAGEVAHTANELSQQATTMAQSIARTAMDAATLLKIAGRLTEGAHEGVERNARLRTLAQENRGRLDDSSAALEALGRDAEAAAAAAAGAAAAFEEIRSFVTLVRKIARQSKLLALNASMEAARAGEQGEGFAVVASEIRKLAASSADAAARTEETVKGLLERAEASRASSLRTATTVRSVQGATREALESFAQVEGAVREAEGWTKSIEQAAEESRQFILEATGRLEELSRGTESFAAAMQQVAAATEEQSAGAQEIAAAAAALATASRRLLDLVSAFRLDEAAARSARAEAGATATESAPPAPPAPPALSAAAPRPQRASQQTRPETTSSVVTIATP